jgi:hypothetical protein
MLYSPFAMLLSNEEKIIFLASRLNPSKKDVEDIIRLVTSGSPKIDFKKLIQLAAHNGVAPLLYKNLKPLEILSEEVLSELRNLYLYSIAGNLQKANVLLEILRLLKDQGIAAIPIKGVLAAEIIFENPGLYYGSDIDILVKPSELQKVKHILIESGYDYNEENEPDMLSSHYHIVFSNDHQLVEVHWNLVKRYFNIPPEFWWEDTLLEPYQGQEILCLSPEKYLICTIFRLYSHMFNPLRFLVLVSELCNKYYKKIDWPHFSRLTKEYGMARLITFSLKLSNELLGTKVPDNILNRKIVGYNFFKRSIINQLFRDVTRPHMGKILYVFLMDSPFHIFRHFLMRVFPGKSELRLRYGIPEGSRTLPFYYALNPILLPFLMLRKRLDTRYGKFRNN